MREKILRLKDIEKEKLQEKNTLTQMILRIDNIKRGKQFEYYTLRDENIEKDGN